MHMGIAFCTKGKMPWVTFTLTILHTGIISVICIDKNDSEKIIVPCTGNIAVTPKVPEVNQTATISCFVPAIRFWYLPAGLVQCNNVVCIPETYSSYKFLADSDKTEFILQSLNRTRDERVWTCQHGATNYSVNLQIYTIPQGLDLTQTPDMNADLGMTSVTIQCRTTSCTYPEPSIEWMYQDQPTSNMYKMYTRAIPLSTQGPCVSPEKIYTGSIYFPQNITWSDNSDKTVIFFCRIGYSDPSKNITSFASRTVSFAVRVTEAFLQHNNQNMTSTLTVTSGEQVTLTCLTGTSRPSSTIDWYIGSRSVGSGTNLIFTPSNTDHNQVIYCQAYNLDPNLKVDSNKPNLFVRVRVTEAFLQHNNQNITSTLTVTSGEQIALTCVTGTSRPAPIIDWYIGSRSVGSGTNLIFTPSNTDHNQVIYCQAYNIDPNLKIDSNKPNLFVRVAPRILNISPNYKGYVGQNIIIQFDFYSNTEENLTITARHSNSSGLIYRGIIRPILLDHLPVYSSHVPAPCFRATVVISITSENDFGQYDIEVKNIIGSDLRSIQIIQQITPEKPINFHASNVQVKQLSLMWLSGYHGGFAQTFIVEASLDNITWINVSHVNAGNRDGWFSATIEDLIPGSEYYLRLYSYNIKGRGDFADVQLAIKTLKESAYTSSLEVGASVGIGIGGVVLGLVGTIIAITIRRRINGPKSSCYRSKGKTDAEMHTYSNTEMNPQTVKPIYEELNKGNTERNVYDKISPL